MVEGPSGGGARPLRHASRATSPLLRNREECERQRWNSRKLCGGMVTLSLAACPLRAIRNRSRIVAEVLHDERAVVIGEQRDMVRRIDADRRIGEQIGLDPRHHRLRQRIEVAEILRHRPQVKRALRIMVHQHDREALGRRHPADDPPAVVGVEAHFGEQHRRGLAGLLQLGPVAGAEAVEIAVDGNDVPGRLPLGELVEAVCPASPRGSPK